MLYSESSYMQAELRTFGRLKLIWQSCLDSESWRQNGGIVCAINNGVADPGGRMVCICGHLVAGIAGSNTAEGMGVCLLCLYVLLFCVGW